MPTTPGASGKVVARIISRHKEDDVLASVYKGLGIDPGTQIRDNLSRPLQIAKGKPLEGIV